jgi:hypothetical protein
MVSFCPQANQNILSGLASVWEDLASPLNYADFMWILWLCNAPN